MPKLKITPPSHVKTRLAQIRSDLQGTPADREFWHLVRAENIVLTKHELYLAHNNHSYRMRRLDLHKAKLNREAEERRALKRAEYMLKHKPATLADRVEPTNLEGDLL